MTIKNTSAICLVLFFVLRACCASATANNEALPRWEFGVGLGGQALRDYRGSKESQIQAFPIPILVYRGSFFKADRDGVRGEFLSSDRFEFNVSGESALNGESDDNDLREGMPELESAFELGPSFNINLTGESFREGLQLRFPVRGVVTAGSSGLNYIGYNINPRLSYTWLDVFGSWRARANIGALYSSRAYHEYFYSVDREFVTENRGFYKAKEGFSGTTFKLSLARKHNEFWYAVSFRYDDLTGATFEDSPLVETNSYFAVSFIFAWMHWQSVD